MIKSKVQALANFLDVSKNNIDYVVGNMYKHKDNLFLVLNDNEADYKARKKVLAEIDESLPKKFLSYIDQEQLIENMLDDGRGRYLSCDGIEYLEIVDCDGVEIEYFIFRVY